MFLLILYLSRAIVAAFISNLKRRPSIALVPGANATSNNGYLSSLPQTLYMNVNVVS